MSKIFVAGLGAVSPAGWNVATLRAAIQRVVDDADLRRGAQAIGDEMAALLPIDRAVDSLVDMLRADP